MGNSESQLTRDPWRRLQTNSADAISNDITKLKPKITPRILLIGPVGGGKSSFINACKSIGTGWKTYDAQTGCTDGSLTLKLTMYSDPNLLKEFHVLDCMGIEGADGKGVQIEDIELILKGHIKHDYEFDEKRSIGEKDKYYRPNPKFDEKTHCVVFVISAITVVNGIAKKLLDKIRWIQNQIRDAGLPRVLLLTNCDQVCAKVMEDAKNLFKSVKVKQAVEGANEAFAIDIASIHPIINFEIDPEMSEAQKVPILLALRQICQYAYSRAAKRNND